MGRKQWSASSSQRGLLWSLGGIAAIFSPKFAEAYITNVTNIALSSSTTCALIGWTFQVKCWGLNPITTEGTTTPSTMGSHLPYINLGTGTTVSAISSGFRAECAVLNNGNVKCWGENSQGQLGLGTENLYESADGSLPSVSLGSGLTATNVTCGYNHACALLSTAQVKCWGGNTLGQLGLGISTPAVGLLATDMGNNLPVLNLGSGLDATLIHASWFLTCALLVGTVSEIKCWGANASGQLGVGFGGNAIGLLPTDMGDSLPSVNLGANVIPVDFATGWAFVCAITGDGLLKCWGDNSFGQLGFFGGDLVVGDSLSDMGDNLPFVNLGTGVTVKRIAAGDYHACALTGSENVKCWGFNSDGQLGLGASVSSVPIGLNQMGDNLPYVQLSMRNSVIGIGAGGSSSCAIMSNQRVKCWGNNAYGQLGTCSSQNVGTTPSDMGGWNITYVDVCYRWNGSFFNATSAPTTPVPTNGSVDLLVVIVLPIFFFLAIVCLVCICMRRPRLARDDTTPIGIETGTTSNQMALS